MIPDLTLYIPLPSPPKKKPKKGGVAFCYFFSTKYNVHSYLCILRHFFFLFPKLERDRIVKSAISVIFGVFFFFNKWRMNSTAARSIGHNPPLSPPSPMLCPRAL